MRSYPINNSYPRRSRVLDTGRIVAPTARWRLPARSGVRGGHPSNLVSSPWSRLGSATKAPSTRSPASPPSTWILVKTAGFDPLKASTWNPSAKRTPASIGMPQPLGCPRCIGPDVLSATLASLSPEDPSRATATPPIRPMPNKMRIAEPVRRLSVLTRHFLDPMRLRHVGVIATEPAGGIGVRKV